jgi:uncharacterized protein DUF5666
MKVSLLPASFGLLAFGAAALIGAGASAPVEGAVFPSAPFIEGLVVAATDAGPSGPGTLTVHPAIGEDVVLSVDSHTRFRKAGGAVETPDEVPGSSLLPAVQQPWATWFVGLFARARFDSNHVATEVLVGRPEPVLVAGVSDPDLWLNVPGRGKLHLTLDEHTAIRVNGLPAKAGNLSAGDLASALFWLTAGENEALRVNDRTPPPQTFQGVVSNLVTDDSHSLVGFEVTRGAIKMNFSDSSSTQFSLDGKPASAGDLKQGCYVNVLYRSHGDTNEALRVQAFSPRPAPGGSNGEHHENNEPPKGGPKNEPPKGGSTGGGEPGATGNPNPAGSSDQNKPGSTRARALDGVVGSVDAGGHSFSVGHENLSLNFTVDAKTVFRLNDKPAGFGDLKAGQSVRVVFRGTSGGNLALYVLIRQSTGDGSVHPSPEGDAHH